MQFGLQGVDSNMQTITPTVHGGTNLLRSQGATAPLSLSELNTNQVRSPGSQQSGNNMQALNGASHRSLCREFPIPILEDVFVPPQPLSRSGVSRWPTRKNLVRMTPFPPQLMGATPGPVLPEPELKELHSQKLYFSKFAINRYCIKQEVVNFAGAPFPGY